MAKKNRPDLKGYFQTGDRPTQAQFEDFIDSKLNHIDDKASQADIENGSDDEKFVTSLGAKNAVIKHAPVKKVNGISPNALGDVTITDITGSASTITGYITKSQVVGLDADLNAKQSLLVSGTSIKTINNNSLLGNGDIVISAGGGAIKIIGIPSNSHPLTSSSAQQTAFPAGCDEFTLTANKTYFFKGKYLLSTGATSHTTSIGWLATGLNITSIEYVAKLFSSALNGSVTAMSIVQVSGTTLKAINTTGSTAVTTTIEFEGVLRCTTGGILKPILAFSAAPGGTTNALKVGSFIEFTEIGDNTVVAVGTVG
jgi:hypothetical protein